MLSSQLKESEQILAGVIEYYSMPNITATLFDRGIEEFQKKLVRGSKENTEEVFTLDGTPNDELDRNPGKMSGDCTDGLPLPFGDPNIPLFNIKVFKGEGNHMGNIYLLETQDEEKRQVWHLDAIQVPASVDWDKFIKTFFDALFAEAEKKGVAGITVNDESHHISNYDYISKAVLDYLEKSGIDETIKIDYPKYKKKGYSHLQTDGNVFFIPVPNK